MVQRSESAGRLSGLEELAAELRLRVSAKRRARAPELGSLRECSSQLARNAATQLDEWWDRSVAAPAGPIDVVDMFSGCGGMSAGFRAINGVVPAYNIIAAVDVDPVANRSYQANFGVSPLGSSVGDLAADKSQLRRMLRESGRREDRPLVLIGCSPCQGFSSHRNSGGKKDARNPLFVDFSIVAAELKPDVVVVENVPELLTDKYWPLVEDARNRLRAAGYVVHLSVHNMATFGVPQERFRTLLLAMKRPFLPLEGFTSRNSFRTVRDAIGFLPAVQAGERDPSDPMHYSAGHKPSTIQTIQAVPRDGGNRPANVGPACLIRAREKQGRGAYDDVYGRLAWGRPAITITAYARNPASGRFVHPEQDRGLTVREAALLQSFPKSYSFSGSLDERFRQIGNAVPPAFSTALAAHLLGELLDDPWAGPVTPSINGSVGASFSRLIPALKAGHNELSTLAAAS